MLQFPNVDPAIARIGPVTIYWYGFMYLVGFALAWLLGSWRLRTLNITWTKKQLEDLIFYCALGVVMGGRLGYMLIYNFSELIHEPLSLFKTWHGGMSFHGGLIGVLIAIIIYSKKFRRPFGEVADFLAPLVPLGLAAGRLGNFIGGELWGRVTTMPWGMVFPTGGLAPRHPSQLYEFFLEGIVLFTIIWVYSSKTRPRLAVSFLFLFCYGCLRFFVEFFRQPDIQLGFIAFGWLTMGQLLSSFMIWIGLVGFCLSYATTAHQKNRRRAQIR